MSLVLSLVTQVLHAGLMIIAAPSVAAALSWLDARFAFRKGPPIVQPWRDLIRLSRKTPVIEESASVVSRVAPAIGLGAMFSAAALVPSFTTGMALAPLSDVLVIVSLMTVARMASGLAALDSGTALAGLAAQASSMRAALAEPALMLGVFSLAPISGSVNLDTIVGQQHDGVLLPTADSAVTLSALLILVFVDASGVDRGLDQMLSGTGLAAARMTGWLRRLVWLDLIGGVLLPAGIATADGGPLAWLIGLAFWAVRLGLLTAGLSGALNLIGRRSHGELPGMIGIAALLALMATIMVLASTGLA